MVQARLFLVAILTLAVPMQVVAAISTELCLTFAGHEAGTTPAHGHGASPAGNATSAHDHAAHDHTDHDASGATHCGPCTACCATGSIAASPETSIPDAPQGGIISPLLPSPGNGLTYEFDRPPQAL